MREALGALLVTGGALLIALSSPFPWLSVPIGALAVIAGGSLALEN